MKGKTMHLFICGMEMETDLYKEAKQTKRSVKVEAAWGMRKVHYVYVWECPQVTHYTPLKVKKKKEWTGKRRRTKERRREKRDRRERRKKGKEERKSGKEGKERRKSGKEEREGRKQKGKERKEKTHFLFKSKAKLKVLILRRVEITRTQVKN